MNPDLRARYDRLRLPRYTGTPTAPRSRAGPRLPLQPPGIGGARRAHPAAPAEIVVHRATT
jgi:hypothetical protein